MKTIKIFILLLTLCSLSVHAQVGKVLTKTAGKEMVKSAIKSSAKKAVLKGTAKTVKKEMVEAALKKNAKKMAGDIVEKEAQLAAKKMAQKTASKASAKAIRSNVVRSGAKNIAKQSGKKAVKAGTKRTVQTGTKRLLNEADDHFIRKTASKVTLQKAVVQAEMTAERKALAKTLNKRAFEEWAKIAGNDVAKDKILLHDLTSNRQLLKVLSNNPALLTSYNNMIRSACRTDITMLRYAGNNADIYRNIMFKRASPNRAWLKGNDLNFVDQNGKTYIINNKTQETLGQFMKTSNNSYLVKVSNTVENNPLLDMYPLKNTTYIKGNNCWKTDETGRVKEVIVTLKGKVTKAKRDDKYIPRIKDFKNKYDNGGYMKKPIKGQCEDDIAGHLIADSWGGESCFMNIIPQNGVMNNKGLWKSAEIQGKNQAKNGHDVVRKLILDYPDRTSLRPSQLKLSQWVDGKVHNVKGTMLEDFVFDNPLISPSAA